MDTESQLQKGNDNDVLSALNVAIGALNLAKEVASITPARAVFGSVGVLLAMIRDSVINEQDYVELGLSCADVCKALNRGLNGKRPDELSQFVLGAIGQLTITVVAIQKKIAKQGKRNAASRIFHAKSDKDAIAAWKQDLIRVLHVFNTELAINTHILVADIHRNALAGQEGARHNPGPSPKQPSSSSSKSTNLDRAIKLARKAIDEDVKQNYAEALRQYQNSLGYFSQALKYEKDDRSKQLIRSKIDEYLARAETLKKHLAPREKPKNKATRTDGVTTSLPHSTDNLDRAIELVQGAIKEDLKQNHMEAYRRYLNSVDYFTLALKHEKSDKNKRIIQSKVNEYLARADALKAYLQREKTPVGRRAK